MPNATVRLRNLAANQIEQVVTANQIGQFTFIARPEIPYVVEIADRVGRILAVGDIITAQAGEVAGAIIAIPSRLPAVAGVFGNTASSVVLGGNRQRDRRHRATAAAESRKIARPDSPQCQQDS